jgi:cyanophycinase
MAWKSSTSRRIAFVLLGFTALLIFHRGLPARPATEPSRIEDPSLQHGTLVIAGGGCVTAEIRERFIALAGGAESRIVVIPAVDPQPGHEDEWLEPWRRHGAARVELLNAANRKAANDPAVSELLNRATGVWISGGYQSLLAERYVDTRAQDCLKDVLRRNGVVGGCSAGAAILSGAMIEVGEDSPVEARGLGLINAVVDQHFLHRNRVWRMQQMLEAHPGLIGIGVDEGTALVVDLASGRLTTLGDSYALICLPQSASGDLRMEVLKGGDEVSLAELEKSHLAYQQRG